MVVTFFLRSVARMVPTILVASLGVFFVMRFLPGDSLQIRFEEADLPPAEMEIERARLGLDKPLYQQYVVWAGNMLRGNLGRSLWTDREVLDEVRLRYPVTLQIALSSTLISSVFGVTAGIVGAKFIGRAPDYLTRMVAVFLIAVPDFLLATLLILFLSLYVGWIPSHRYTHFVDDPLTNITQIGVPVLLVGLSSSGSIMRYTRSTMLDVLGSDYIRTARAKGLREVTVLWRHGLRNALAPVLAVIGLSIAGGIGGTLIVEVIFGLPGIGAYFLKSATLRDYTSVQALAMIFAIGVVFVNTLIDTLTFALVPHAK